MGKKDKKLKVWVVGSLRDYATSSWSIYGIFFSEKKAVAACAGNAARFVGPVNMGEIIPEGAEWPGAYYPSTKAGP